MRRQQTIGRRVSCTGIGLHSGAPVRLTLLPAEEGAGLVVERRAVGGGEGAVIPARASTVASTRRATALSHDGARVATVEHLLAALYGLGVDNARIVVDGPEVPGMDGSAASFVHLIRSAGVVAQREPCRVLRPRRPIEIRRGARWIRCEPARRFRVSYAIEFDHPAVGRQELELEDTGPARFEREVAAARTFGFLHELESLRAAGLAKGGTLENAVVLDDRGVINPGGLRWPDEFVRHKVLDLYGDLALLGTRLEGHVRVERGGHALHLELVRALTEGARTGKEADSVSRPTRSEA